MIPKAEVSYTHPVLRAQNITELQRNFRKLFNLMERLQVVQNLPKPLVTYSQ